jgi:hypothetical protein
MMSVATSERRPVEERVAALAEAPLAVGESEENLQALLRVLRNPNEPSPVRLATLQTFQAAAFSSAYFPSWRGDYIAALRDLVDDPDPELRQRVLGILAREKDGFVQQKLLEGLRDPSKALVPPEKALQLMSYDVHAEAYGVARQIVDQPPNPQARQEALRLLAADASSAPVFERILRDKAEPTELRQMAAAALQATNPRQLREYAREIVLDDSEDEELQATSLAALTQFGESATVADDQALRKRVDDLSKGALPALNQSAQRFLDKYGR